MAGATCALVNGVMDVKDGNKWDGKSNTARINNVSRSGTSRLAQRREADEMGMYLCALRLL